MLRAQVEPRAGLMCSESASLTFQALAAGMNSRIVVLTWFLSKALPRRGGVSRVTE